MSKLKILIPILLITIILAACNKDDPTSPSDSDIQEDKRYDLVWMELVNNGDSESLTYQIGYMDGNTQKSVRVNGNDIIERIAVNPEEKATITVDDDKFIVYRHPVNIMKDTDLKGTVDSKGVSE